MNIPEDISVARIKLNDLVGPKSDKKLRVVVNAAACNERTAG
jgi:hypothetical protein